jgi:hypothetical protein
MRVAGAAVVVLAFGLAWSGCRKELPPLTLKFKAVTPQGDALPGVSVEALGKVQGKTDAEGKLAFTFTKEVGEEVALSAALDRPGMQFKPWRQTVVVRKWDDDRPETREYSIEAKLEPAALSATIDLQSGGAPATGAEIRIDGKPAKLDPSGHLTVDLGTSMSRSAKVSVRMKDFQPFEQTASLRAGETFVVPLVKIGAVYGKVLVAYEAMERTVPVPGADVVLGGKPIGKTDATGALKYQAPDKEGSLEVKKDGFLPQPATTKVPPPKGGADHRRPGSSRGARLPRRASPAKKRQPGGRRS